MTSKTPHRPSHLEYASTLKAQPNTASNADLLNPFSLGMEASDIPSIPLSSSLGSTTTQTPNPKNIQSAVDSIIQEPVASVNTKVTVGSDPWRCKECGVKASETPLKRKGPDGTRVRFFEFVILIQFLAVYLQRLLCQMESQMRKSRKRN